MNHAARLAPKPPLVWANTLMFVLTVAVALVAVPWYGLTHGFTAATWMVAVLFTGANGMAITAGYHRLWAHSTYEAHWSVRLLLLVFGTMALQNSVFAWAAATAPTTCTWTMWIGTRIRRGAASGSRTSAGCCASTRAAGANFTNIPDLKRDPMLAFQHRYYVPLALLPTSACRCSPA